MVLRYAPRKMRRIRTTAHEAREAEWRGTLGELRGVWEKGTQGLCLGLGGLGEGGGEGSWKRRANQSPVRDAGHPTEMGPLGQGGVRERRGCLGWRRVPDLANTNTGYPLKLEFQINNQSFFSISTS